MKIEQFDKDILRIRVGNFGILFFIISTLFTGAFLLAAGETITLSCIRDSTEVPVCKLERSLLGIPVSTTQFRNLKNAYVVEEGNSEGGTTYRVELVTDDYQVIPFTEHTSNNYVKQEYIVEKVKLFAHTGQSTLEIVQKNNGTLIMGITIIIVGLLTGIAGLGTSNTTWTFDRTNEVLIHRRGVLFGTKAIEYPLYDITDARVETRDGYEGAAHRIVLITKRWQTIPLTTSYSSFNPAKKETVAKHINEFLDMRWQR